ncbi:MAG: peptidoglycan editing factor PgeF [Lachnospiraceae bacterium]|nr:peptidoglycan editing factor PgeF [Lachnospiraceae bacterium]
MDIRYADGSLQKEFYRDKDVKDGYLSFDKGIPFIRFHSLEELDWLEAGFSTRLGGVSQDYLSSLNLRLSSEDSKENLHENYRRCAKVFESDLSHLIVMEQVHGIRVVEADPVMVLGEDLSGRAHETDGIITKEKELVLSGTYADCVPIFLAERRNHQVGMVHSGWRGSVGKIGEKAVQMMCQAPGTAPSDIIAVIGPSISQANYEVTGEVVDQFTKIFSSSDLDIIAEKTDEVHYQLDLWAACFLYLNQAGIPEEQIHFSGICTFDNPEIFYSHRYTNGRRGNMNGFIKRIS